MCDVTLARVPNIKRVNTGHLMSNVKDTASMFHCHARLPSHLPKIGQTMITTLSSPRTLGHTRRRCRFTQGGHVSYFALTSRSCPSHLQRYSSTPIILFFGKGTGLGTLRVVGVIKAHGTASCKGRVYIDFLRRLRVLYPSILMIDKLTCKVSVGTRHSTLSIRLPAIKMLTRKLSHVCPSLRHGATVSVLQRNKLLARFLSKAGPSGRGFVDQGHVITNVDSTAVIIRSTTGNNSLVATSVTKDCRHSYFTFPKQIASRCSGKYGRLVRSGGTILLRSTSSFIGTVN